MNKDSTEHRKEKEMKTYKVYFWIKANKFEYLRSMEIESTNAKEACKKVKDIVFETTGKNAFRPQTKAITEDEIKNYERFSWYGGYREYKPGMKIACF